MIHWHEQQRGTGSHKSPEEGSWNTASGSHGGFTVKVVSALSWWLMRRNGPTHCEGSDKVRHIRKLKLIQGGQNVRYTLGDRQEKVMKIQRDFGDTLDFVFYSKGNWGLGKIFTRW